MSNPTISIIIATFNSARTLDFCLRRVREQVYDKNKIEIIVADGGSKDSTLKIAKKYGAKIINVNKYKQSAEYNKGVGLKYAKNEIVLFLDHDNILPHKNWLIKITAPFTKNSKIVGVEPLRFYYDKKMTLLDRYFALLGGSDPVVYYLGKDSHLSWAFDKYNLLGDAKDLGDYYLVKFSSGKVPALGGNGAALKRKILLKYAKADPDNFIHTDVVFDLITSGFNNYGLIKDSIIHLTNNKLIPFLLRRKYFIEKYQIEQSRKRRYHIYDPQENIMDLIKFILITLTIVIPLRDSIRGFIKIKDVAWFIHPFMCLSFLIIYGAVIVKGKGEYA